MARVLIPQNPRTYNPNARGAVTTIVHMKSNNPFENASARVMQPAMMRRGQMIAGLGADAPAEMSADTGATPAATPTDTSSIDWSKIASAGASVALKMLQPAAATPRQVIVPAPGMSTTKKLLIAGGIGGALLLVFVMMKRS